MYAWVANDIMLHMFSRVACKSLQLYSCTCNSLLVVHIIVICPIPIAIGWDTALPNQNEALLPSPSDSFEYDHCTSGHIKANISRAKLMAALIMEELYWVAMIAPVPLRV